MNRILEAYLIANDAHKNQKYDEKDYIFHLSYVYLILERFGIQDENILISGFLHDLFEDTDYDKQKIIEIFGRKVYRIIENVTDEPGKNRKERKIKTYPKILSNYKSVTVKLADRIANVEYSAITKNKILDMYIKEHEEFSRYLKTKYLNNKIISKMWRYLDNLIQENS